MEIFRSFRHFYQLLIIYNPSQFYGRNQRIIRNIFQTVGITSFHLTLLTTFSGGIWFFFCSNGSWEETMPTIPISISAIRTIFMYIAMVLQNQRVGKAIENLQQIVNCRKLGSYLF